MSPQFVDFNGDGHLDIVAGTFSGSPWIAFGTADGFAQPGMIHDRSGERIVIDAAHVESKLAHLVKDEDYARYVL